MVLGSWSDPGGVEGMSLVLRAKEDHLDARKVEEQETE